MPTGFAYKVGDFTSNGWLVLSESVNRRRDFGCPLCGKAENSQTSNIIQKFSCGCARVDRRRGNPHDEKWTPDQYPELIRLATAAFRADSNYGIEIAEAANRIRERSGGE